MEIAAAHGRIESSERRDHFYENRLQPGKNFQIQKDGLVARGILRIPASHQESAMSKARSAPRMAAVHPPGSGPGEASKLVRPTLFEVAALGDAVRHMDGQVGSMPSPVS